MELADRRQDIPGWSERFNDEEEWPPRWTYEHEKAVQTALNSDEMTSLTEEAIREMVIPMYPRDLKWFMHFFDTQKERERIADMDDDCVFISTGERLGTIVDPDPWDRDYKIGEIVDLKGYWDIIRTREFGRLGDIHQLGPIQYIYQFMSGNSRYIHSVITLSWARKIADAIGLKGKKRKLVEAHAFLHDIGHIVGGHATETYLDMIRGFSHEKFGVEQLKKIRKQVEKLGIKLEDLIPIFLDQDPLSEIISGQVGADRLAYAKQDLDNPIGELVHRGVIQAQVPFPRMDKIAESFTCAEGRYVPQTSAVEDIANLIELRSMSYAFFYFNRNVDIAEAIFSKVLQELEMNKHTELAKFSDAWLEHEIFNKAKKGTKRVKDAVQLFRRLNHGDVHPYAVSLKLREGMSEPDNRNMSWGAGFRTVDYPDCYAEQITEPERETLRGKYSGWKETQKLEKRLMRHFRLGRTDIAVCNYIQRDVAPKEVPIWDGRKMINLHDEFPELRQKHSYWMKQNYGFRIAVAEHAHAKVMEYFSRKKNLLKFVMDAV